MDALSLLLINCSSLVAFNYCRSERPTCPLDTVSFCNHIEWTSHKDFILSGLWITALSASVFHYLRIFQKVFWNTWALILARSTDQFHDKWDPGHTDKCMLMTDNIDFISVSYTKQTWATPVMYVWPALVGKEILGSKLVVLCTHLPLSMPEIGPYLVCRVISHWGWETRCLSFIFSQFPAILS